MEAKFDVHGVLQIAENLQRKGSRFYLQAAERFVDTQCSDLCRWLARWKASVAQRQEQIPPKAAAPRTTGRRDYVSTHPFVMADLGTLACSTGKGATLTGQEPIDGILKIAIIRTEYAIAFYRGLKDFVRDQAGIEALDTIIEEEKSHITALTKRLTSQKSLA